MGLGKGKRGDPMRLFPEAEELVVLERQGKWEEARALLYSRWSADQRDAGKLYRLLSECWYVLAEWGCCIRDAETRAEQFQKTLMEVTRYGMAHFYDDASFLWMAGYMICLFPHLFYEGTSGELFPAWEKRGKGMLARSVQMDPDNLLSKVLYLGARPDASEAYALTKKQLAPYLHAVFPGNTAIEVYFRDVLKC